MKLKLTIDIFSGRENPAIIISGAKAASLMKKINPSSRLSAKESIREPFTLGYRGIIVEQLDKPVKGIPALMQIAEGIMFGNKKSYRIDDSGIMNFVLDNLSEVKNVKLNRGFKSLLAGEINNLKKIRQKGILDSIIWPGKINKCACAPVYEPDWWNNNAAIKSGNNCYNYACNYRTDTFAQPGKATGNQYTYPGGLSGCTVAAPNKSVKDGAISDCLENSPSADNKCPKMGHLVALVIWPNTDFHWYRKGNNGKWSHKPGGTSATNLDNSGNIITDPRTANRGGYTQFCTFMVVKHGHIKIK